MAPELTPGRTEVSSVDELVSLEGPVVLIPGVQEGLVSGSEKLDMGVGTVASALVEVATTGDVALAGSESVGTEECGSRLGPAVPTWVTAVCVEG